MHILVFDDAEPIVTVDQAIDLIVENLDFVCTTKFDESYMLLLVSEELLDFLITWRVEEEDLEDSYDAEEDCRAI